MELLVVGAGEMGRWFARDSGATSVAFADRDIEVAEEATATLGSDIEARAVELDGDERFEVVCIAVPMTAVPDAIATHAPRATRAVVDVSGEMRDAVAALGAHAGGRERASFHPLFSSSNAPGNVPVVVDQGGEVVAEIRAALEAAGNEVFETTAVEHDRAMETVQAKAHTALLAYALSAEATDPRFHTTLSAPLDDLVDELVDNTPEVYAEIQARYDGSDAIAEAARLIADADSETFTSLYEDADR